MAKKDLYILPVKRESEKKKIIHYVVYTASSGTEIIDIFTEDCKYRVYTRKESGIDKVFKFNMLDDGYCVYVYETITEIKNPVSFVLY